MKRMTRLSTLIVVAVALLLGVFTTTSSASAATIQPAGPQTATLNQTGELETKLEDLTDTLTDLGRPLTVLALVLALLSYVAEPALPEWARENRGIIRRVLFAAIFIGLVPDLVDFFMG